ncbi:heme NO-binding domain-containing protein [Winogradskyella haliclonae]|uniref:Guanylate cyclase n=1 Tax=Winogradskyella haliclonae TaxID=2048558 RepID=A0ABQ2BXD6_9FLAO|nr:heme NO-binding domain-containing protein [Winogradskyella haliclonae]GGI56178.1 guanylate cyclase [Winogradskyella haliclonae]
MKGIVFTEFLDLVEDKFGLATVQEIIDQTELSTGGSYTAVGTYPFSEMLGLLKALSAKTSISIDDLLKVYAEHFFGVLVESYPQLIESYKDPIEMLSSIENHIHIEVRKIYSDAELPSFETLEKTNNKLIMIYRSSRAMYSFGLGLMHKTFESFDSKATILVEKIKDDGTEVKFSITKNE